MGCNCKRNKARVLTPKMLIRQQEMEEQARKEKEAQEKEAQNNG